MTPRTSRADNRAARESDIRRLGREHLRAHGAAGLSLRAIARDLGVVSSAVYRYVPSRDELLTMLLVEAYSELADATQAAMNTTDSRDPRRRLVALAHGMRSWAVADPARWALLYGSPVPGYAAPADRTVAPGTRVIMMILEEIGRADAMGLLPAQPSTSRSLTREFDAIRAEFGRSLSDSAVLLGVSFWSTTIGAISLEVFGQYGSDTFADPARLFDAQIDRVLGAWSSSKQR